MEPPVLLPHLGVANMAGAVGRIGVISHHDGLGTEVDAVVGLDERLVGEAPRIGAVTHPVTNVSGVVEPQLVVGDVSPARVGAVAIALAVRHDVAAEEGPVDEIPAHEMSPAMGAVGMGRIGGRILTEEVVRTPKLVEAVGNAHRPVVGREMQFGTPGLVAHCWTPPIVGAAPRRV